MEQLARSFRFAFQGLKEALAERNFRIQAAIGAAALLLAFALRVSFLEKLMILLCAVMVLGGEMANSAMERLADFVSTEHRDEIRQTKDLMAGMVLLLAGGAFVIGIAIFAKALWQQ